MLQGLIASEGWWHHQIILKSPLSASMHVLRVLSWRRMVQPFVLFPTIIGSFEAELPRLKGLIQDIMAEPCLKLDLLPSQTLASKILERANLVIRGLASNSCFKIGLTSNPVHRWSNDGYGYLHSSNPSWNEMRIVALLASGEAAGFLEAALIDRWQRDHRCQNSATGGEGISTQEGPFCVYVVVSTR